jgi:hypothetical protein
VTTPSRGRRDASLLSGRRLWTSRTSVRLTRKGPVQRTHSRLMFLKCTTPPQRNMIAGQRWYFRGRLPQMPAGQVCRRFMKLRLQGGPAAFPRRVRAGPCQSAGLASDPTAQVMMRVQKRVVPFIRTSRVSRGVPPDEHLLGCTVMRNATSVLPSKTSSRWLQLRQRYSSLVPGLVTSSMRR